ncbi:hypothetical protein VOLCADRAFT_87671 [Volvox carteri f. nagariensis]|uniref:Uncharacterized protein n=1 Tax=Volvox carteri f. nagariensis TaxID=3068 RepID=D8TLY3_VOLCA|nr:uncharacterized protein VOLCADRAFT_87671 [Volvox carteri f. nagariensis]EFJ51542.1 hypothetical protein VOLCADRAFT_87671 [Volvox carteri f. nagariensis]|eukprot:XP_002947494.1 hypothetical protein VOLCADRAFT_87671 [Volvox carteri f. nagariensis]
MAWFGGSAMALYHSNNLSCFIVIQLFISLLAFFGVYCSQAIACPSFDGYIAFPDTDHGGDDLGNPGSAAAAATECAKLPDCQGFNVNGWMKASVEPLTYFESVCFFKKTPACPSFDGYIAFPDTDHGGDDLGNPGSAAAAATECAKLPDCQGFNVNGWMKASADPLTYLESVCFFKKIPGPPPPLPPSPPPPTPPGIQQITTNFQAGFVGVTLTVDGALSWVGTCRYNSFYGLETGSPTVFLDWATEPRSDHLKSFPYKAALQHWNESAAYRSADHGQWEVGASMKSEQSLTCQAAVCAAHTAA